MSPYRHILIVSHNKSLKYILWLSYFIDEKNEALKVCCFCKTTELLVWLSPSLCSSPLCYAAKKQTNWQQQQQQQSLFTWMQSLCYLVPQLSLAENQSKFLSHLSSLMIQSTANYSPRVKSSLSPIFVKKGFSVTQLPSFFHISMAAFTLHPAIK